MDILYGNQLLQRQHFHVSGGGGSFNYLYAVRYFNVQLNWSHVLCGKCRINVLKWKVEHCVRPPSGRQAATDDLHSPDMTSSSSGQSERFLPETAEVTLFCEKGKMKLLFVLQRLKPDQIKGTTRPDSQKHKNSVVKSPLITSKWRSRTGMCRLVVRHVWLFLG